MKQLGFMRDVKCIEIRQSNAGDKIGRTTKV